MAMLITLILIQFIFWSSAAAFSLSRRIESVCRKRTTPTIIEGNIHVLYSSSSSLNLAKDASDHDENLVPTPVAADADADTDAPQPPLADIEKAWRHAKKPLLRIGSKGFSKSHGNSLRQLLEDHVIVKVKLNTDKYGSLQDVATILSKLAEDAGAPPGVEYIQSRDIEKTILLGMPGTLSRIASGDFPPPPPPRWKTSEEMAAEKANTEL